VWKRHTTAPATLKRRNTVAVAAAMNRRTMKFITLISMLLILSGWAFGGDCEHDSCDGEETCECCTCEQTVDGCSGNCCECEAEECDETCTCECEDCEHSDEAVEVVKPAVEEDSHCGGCHGGVQ
jgi:hypothetical protein